MLVGPQQGAVEVVDGAVTVRAQDRHAARCRDQVGLQGRHATVGRSERGAVVGTLRLGSGLRGSSSVGTSVDRGNDGGQIRVGGDLDAHAGESSDEFGEVLGRYRRPHRHRRARARQDASQRILGLK